MFRKLIIILCLAFPEILPLTGVGATMLAEPDSIRVTLLTCSPGPEVYSLYGHTALRVQVPDDSLDVVFNYGVFDMSKPFFAWHFVLGQTDYMVMSIPWQYFPKDYEMRGSSITEQELNLTRAEASRLLGNLIENCLPENRRYRYNFLYGNCTTKVRDMVEQVVVGSIQYPDSLPQQTAREILHQYTAGHPWAQNGNDLLLGAEVDTVMSERAAMFIPYNMMQAFDGAFIRNAKGDMRPLVRSRKVILEANPAAPQAGGKAGASPSLLDSLAGRFSPLQATFAFGGLCLFIMLLEVCFKSRFWLWDVLLLLLQGLAGTLLAFMFLFSEHPAVDSNWQVWLLNPLYLVGIPFVIKSATRSKTNAWYSVYFSVLALFLLFCPWIPQVFAKITVPLALCLLTRPVSYYLVKDKKGKGERLRKAKRNKR